MKSDFLVGVSLGVGQVNAILCDGDFNILERESRPFAPKMGKESIATKIEKTITSLPSFHKAAAVAVAAPAIFDQTNKLIKSSSIDELLGANLYQLLSKKIDLPLFITRRSFCLMLAEQAFGQAKGRKNAVVVEIGKDIDCAFEINGKIFRGATGSSGQISSTIVDITREKRSSVGSFGSLVSGEGISALTGKSVYQILKENPKSDLVSKQIIRDLKDSLLTGLLNIKLMLDPEIFIITGDILENFNLFKGAFYDLGVEVFPSELGRDGAALGAAITAYNGIEKIGK
ncbi:MAG: Beta-glucoside kinase [candidate division WS2 bacterium ADurb.Bin280]|uniref:Beta-glucoside kinase n=1 Tax=candidate division WS2 bacterium ADurb.Bin280 TaxID=1852829 RepID=A0A1V5SDJ8_9BACT|nr:MAG: Beta-glucoside kinase [candidate division WS2 bacterium ADurb.Bin280]